MSNAHTDIHQPEPSDRKILFSAIGWVGVILLFGVIVLIAYGPNQGTNSIEAGGDARLQIKREVFAAQNKLATGYVWVDQANGQVRVPIERAKALTLQQLQAENQQKLEGNAAQ
ncbi:MAG: hypothetical protein Q7P63_00425 [Verrucomicrobiota bacterium JB022]|nr:hypothetical protein [Verrucomicrobiota bacterium JB022]